ncbi:hypothetical protein DFH07DRAFT_813093 [Mycena maculata]|uniref:DUF7223 domain-containing protein n=1 Tax=Mycena maculata TaxID=230809 RepID=A0AAD7NJS2_9AGAR|nr:hypothetical protein DFH07DRAFT_813093 [Mycena maculata]
MLSSVLVLVPFVTLINAANDWSVPCITGECSYDIPTTNGTASGTMAIWGSQDAISDITTAADWQILTCDPTALSQDIRLVCMSDASDAKCSNLYQNTGAVNKIVRLPENCGSGPFARVANASVSEDQTIPSSIAARLVRRDGTQPLVQTLSLDTNFSAVDYSKTGQVNIAIQAANVPGASGTIPIPPSKRTTRISQRVLQNFVANVLDANVANVNQTIDLPPLSFDKTVNILNKTISCGPVTASVDINLDGNTQATAQVGVAATGTLIPPKITSFGIVGILNGNVAGTMDIKANVNGQVDSGKVTLLNLGVPGLDIPGILTVGPSLQIDAQVTADFDVNLDMTVGINLALDNTTLNFPPGSGAAPNAELFSIGDTPLSLSASPDVTATGNVTAHLIPSLNLGVSALGNAASAQVFLSLDTSATLQLNLEGSLNASTVIDESSSTDSDSTTTETDFTTYFTTIKETEGVTTVTKITDVTSTTTVIEDSTITHSTATATPAAYYTPASKASTTASTSYQYQSTYGRDVTTSFGGCFEVDAGIDVTAGADASFFGLFDPNVSDTLFSKNFVIFKKCFGAAASKRSLFARFSLSRPDRRESSFGRRAALADLTCPASDVGTPASLVDQTIKSAAIKAV